MKGLLDKYVMPNPSNDHKPHLLHKGGALVLAYVIVIIFFVSLIQATFITSPQFTAEVLPRVLVDLANDDRADNQINTLTLNQILVKAAQLKAADMAAEQYFAHTNPYNSEKTPWYWFSQAGYAFKYAGENLAIDFNDSSAVNRAWMDSPGHRANILNAKYTEIGVAVARGMYEGSSVWMAVQEFGRPLSDCPVVSESLNSQISANNKVLDDMLVELDRQQAEIQATRPKRGTAYNQKVDEYNALVEQYNELLNKTKVFITTYNTQVEAFNTCIE